MSDFTPIGNIKIGAVPFDNSYKNVIWFDSIAEQQNYFLSGLSAAIKDGTYRYIKRDSAIQLQGNAEDYQNYNYICYRNTNYGTKWYYAFITNVEYVNENTTRLYIELDSFQTYLFNWDHNEVCFVEREHVADDTIGLHLNPEPNFKVDYCTLSLYQVSNSCDYACIQTTVYPYFKRSGRSQLFTIPINTPDLFGIATGSAILCYDMRIQAQKDAFNSILEDYTAAGVADTIINIFMLPASSELASHIEPLRIDVEETQITVPNTFIFNTNENVLPPTQNIQATRDNKHLTYSNVRNNKLFTYPYTFLRVGDYSGRCTEYKYEFSGYNGYIQLVNHFAPMPDSTGYVMPYNYNGNILECVEDMFTYNNSVTGSWTGSEYATWKMINKDLAIKEMNYQSDLDKYNLTVSLASTVFGLGVAAISRNPLAVGTAVGGGVSSLTDYFLKELKSNAGFSEDQHKIQMAENEYSRIPNHASGNLSGNSRAVYGYIGFYYSQIALRDYSAKMIDDFFSLYGYAVQTVKVPNWHSRENWNYIKTIGANFQSTAPDYDQNVINSIFDNGVTLWHKGSVGNYNIDGYLVNNIIQRG